MAVQNVLIFTAFVVLYGELASCCRSSYGNCLEVEENACSRYFSGEEGSGMTSALFQWSVSPANRGLSHKETLRELEDYRILLERDNYCSYVLHSFLCFHYFSPCLPSVYSLPPTSLPTRPDPQVTIPCREICEEAWSECLNEVFDTSSLKNVTHPEHLNCSRFPSAADDSYRGCTVVCPTPGKAGS